MFRRRQRIIWPGSVEIQSMLDSQVTMVYRDCGSQHYQDVLNLLSAPKDADRRHIRGLVII